MEFKNDQQIDKTIKWVYYFISGILCIFLILLTERILNDLGKGVSYPIEANMENKRIVDSLFSLQHGLQAQAESYTTKKNQIADASALAEKNYHGAKESFDNWLQTRKAIGEPSKDKEVISRTETLDNYFKIQQSWNKETSKISDTLEPIKTQISNFENQINEEKVKSQMLFNSAVEKYELKVFLIRLLFIFPILFLGVYFYVKYRRHKYWPLFIGFSLYSIYAFFIGLVPYLPYYGGYVRYTVGTILSVAGGYYAINKIRDYLDRRKKELQKPTEERNKKVESDTAFKAYELHLCPSCGKDFIYRNWVQTKQNPTETAVTVSNFCRQCGFELFRNCKHCGEKHFAFLPFCSNCGSVNKESKENDFVVS